MMNLACMRMNQNTCSTFTFTLSLNCIMVNLTFTSHRKVEEALQLFTLNYVLGRKGKDYKFLPWPPRKEKDYKLSSVATWERKRKQMSALATLGEERITNFRNCLI